MVRSCEAYLMCRCTVVDADAYDIRGMNGHMRGLQDSRKQAISGPPGLKFSPAARVFLFSGARGPQPQILRVGAHLKRNQFRSASAVGPHAAPVLTGRLLALLSRRRHRETNRLAGTRRLVARRLASGRAFCVRVCSSYFCRMARLSRHWQLRHERDMHES